VFGEVLDGMAVVDKIASVATTAKGEYENVPSTPVVILSARVEGGGRPAAVRPASPRPSPAASGAAPARPRVPGRPRPRVIVSPSPSPSPRG
jgi:hypothetical protein